MYRSVQHARNPQLVAVSHIDMLLLIALKNPYISKIAKRKDVMYERTLCMATGLLALLPSVKTNSFASQWSQHCATYFQVYDGFRPSARWVDCWAWRALPTKQKNP